MATSKAVVYVCQAGTCRAHGSDATLIEIEELASKLGMTRDEEDSIKTVGREQIHCDVEATGCLGYCRRGPAVAVVSKKPKQKRQGKKSILRSMSSSTRIYTEVSGLEKSASIVEDAMKGVLPRPLEHNLAAETLMKLSTIRDAEQREFLVDTYQWNKALQSCLDTCIELSSTESDTSRIVDLKKEIETILVNAGFPNHSADSLIKKEIHGEICADAGLFDSSIGLQPKGYVPWTLKEIEIVSSHSAIFKLRTDDPKRGTPHPRGYGKLPKPNTWHVTMLGCIWEEINTNCKEGPLPWIARDYTPISSALDWERGTCDILIKIYNDGMLTQWLERESLSQVSSRSKVTDLESQKAKIWLSKPIPTLSMPALVPLSDRSSLDDASPAFILLLLAGTGIVALPQIMAHRDPIRMLGIPTPRRKQLQCHIDLIHSCREDDVLMLPEIRQYCVEGANASSSKRPFKGLREYTLLLSSGSENKGAFHDDINTGSTKERSHTCSPKEVLGDIPNAKVLASTRLDETVISRALANNIDAFNEALPVRVVVSGPDAYNAAARSFLVDRCGVDSSHVTILSA